MFETLGVGAAIGRTLNLSDDAAGSAPWATVLSHAFWLRRFGGDPSVLGKWYTFPGSDRRFQSSASPIAALRDLSVAG
jgi:putative ABC transport system permease protein